MRRALFIALAMLAPSPTWADNFTPTPQLGGSVLDFDTANGKYSGWTIDTVGGINAVRTTIQVHRLGDDPRWAPGFTIFVRGGGKEVGFQLFSATREPPLTIHLFAAENGKTVEDQSFTTTIGLDQDLPVAIDWAADGTVTVQAGTEKHTISLGAPVAALSFVGSTGEVEFKPLQIGQTPLQTR